MIFQKKILFVFHHYCKLFPNNHHLTACCPPQAALTEAHPWPAFASMPARFKPRLGEKQIQDVIIWKSSNIDQEHQR